MFHCRFLFLDRKHADQSTIAQAVDLKGGTGNLGAATAVADDNILDPGRDGFAELEKLLGIGGFKAPPGTELSNNPPSAAIQIQHPANHFVTRDNILEDNFQGRIRIHLNSMHPDVLRSVLASLFHKRFGTQESESK